MQGKSLVSVIIPTFNRPLYLPEAVESVLEQTYPEPEIELIIVDDGSDDQGNAAKKALEPYNSSVTYTYQKRGRFAELKRNVIKATYRKAVGR